MIKIMDWIINLFNTLDTWRSSPEVVGFVFDNLLRFVYVGLAFGFAILLAEIRLPLRYYWDLPVHIFKSILMSLRLLKKPVIWGKCVDYQSEKPISLAAVELLDADSRERIKLTFSNRSGEYGFRVNLGKFLVRAVKNYYWIPPFYDPENIQLKASNESFAVSAEVTKQQVPTGVDLTLQPLTTEDLNKPITKALFVVNAIILNLSNGMLILSILGSWYGWIIMQTPLYGLLLAVGIVLLFVKLYILEAIGSVDRENA